MTNKNGNICATPCECKEVRQYERILERSGISDSFKKIGFKEYITKNKEQKEAKEMAINFVKNYENKKGSLALLGQSGAGKTHLSIAIANNLMSKNIGVIYFQYREAITQIKQVANEPISYRKELEKYKRAKVLLIDDLYKFATYRDSSGQIKVNDADMRIMFEIVNYRALNDLSIIISSEYSIIELLKFDEALGGRIVQMAKENIYTFKGVHLNYRIAK